MSKGRKPGGWLPGMNGRAKETPMWLFLIHLVLVFIFTWLLVMALVDGMLIMAGLMFLGWLAAFALASLDNVRLSVVEWTRVYVLVALDSVGLGKKEKEEKG